MPTLRDSLLPSLDSIRSIPGTFGLHRYSLAVLTRATMNPGTQFERLPPDTRLTISPTPRIRVVQTVGERVKADVAIGLDNLAYKVDLITPAYCAINRPVVQTGTGTGSVAVASSIPTAGITPGAWSLLVTIASATTFTYSVNGGTTTVGPLTILATFQVPGIGLLLTFSGSFTTGDTYSTTGTSGGYVPEQLRPTTTAPEVDVLFELTGDEGPFLCTLIRADLDRPFREMALYLRGGRFFP